jgi:hypothetical protein
MATNPGPEEGTMSLRVHRVGAAIKSISLGEAKR